MASAKVTLAGMKAPLDVRDVDVAIVGGGICGILAARHCADRGLRYAVVEREAALGGNWHTLANGYSYLQAFEPMYRWDAKYRLSTDPLTKAPASAVLATLRRYAADVGVPAHTLLGHEAVTVQREPKTGDYLVVVRELASRREAALRARFLFVACGILGGQVTAAERGVRGLRAFRGVATHAGRHAGADCALGDPGVEVAGRHVVVMGSGSFSAEAVEAAGRRGAAAITVVSRPRHRWVLPFSRQFAITALAAAPLLPWSVKMAAAQAYLRRCFYRPCGLDAWLPGGAPEDMDYSGQCTDGLFRLAAEGRLRCVVGRVDRLEARAAVLASGERLPCDVFVVAAGCHYNLDPPFLRELGLGFKDLHNFAFLGPNPRVGCASDFVFAYVPFGPLKQMEMFFHGVDCVRRGLEPALAAALRPTPLPNHGGDAVHKGGRMAGAVTFFEYRRWWSTNSLALEARGAAYLRTLDVGRSAAGRAALRARAAAEGLAAWLRAVALAAAEIWRFPVYGPGVRDHHHPEEEEEPAPAAARAPAGTKKSR